MTRASNILLHNSFKTTSDRQAAADDLIVDTPDPVTAFAAVQSGATTMNLTWTNPVTNAGEFLQIERAVVSATAGTNGRGTVLANTFTASGDLVTDVAHGLIDGDIIVFDTVVTTTGVSADVPVYVVTATDDTFQVEATLAGGALTLTNDGTGTYRAVQFVDFEATGNTVDRTAHGFVDGDIVIFGSIVTTTGITADVRYYVVTATDDTFQVESTVGGGAITLTSNGTGDVYHPTVTFDDTGDLVNVVGHGYAANTRVMFSGIVSTTGLVEDASYYVKAPTTDSFQVSLTPAGAAVALTTNGYGILAIPSVGTYTVQDTVEADDLAWSDTGLVSLTEYSYRGAVVRKVPQPTATRAVAYDQTV